MKVSTSKYQNLLQDDYKLDQENGEINAHRASQLIEAGESQPLNGLTLLVSSLATAMIVGGVLLSLWA